MPEPQPNPHVNENNAREEGRQERRCTRGCAPGLVHPQCEKHGFKTILGSTTNPVWDGPPRAKVPLSAITGILERLTESNTALRKLCHEYIESLDNDDRAWKNPKLVKITKFLDRKYYKK